MLSTLHTPLSAHTLDEAVRPKSFPTYIWACVPQMGKRREMKREKYLVYFRRHLNILNAGTISLEEKSMFWR